MSAACWSSGHRTSSPRAWSPKWTWSHHGSSEGGEGILRKLIIGYDGRPQSRDALALGSMLAKATRADVTVAGVAHLDPPIAVPAGPGVAPAADLEESIAEEILSEVRGPAQGVGGRPEGIISSSAAHGLQRLAEDQDADLIVVGSSHHGTLGRVLMGSVGERLLHGSPCAVAIAPKGFGEGEDRRLATIGVGYDGNREAERALEEAVELAESAGAAIRLIAAVPPGRVVYGKGVGASDATAIEETVRETLTESVDRAVNRLPDGVTGDGSVKRGDPEEVLAEEDVDLMVVGSRRYGPVRTVLLGGVSLPLIRSASHPVLVVPRGAGGETETGGVSADARAAA